MANSLVLHGALPRKDRAATAWRRLAFTFCAMVAFALQACVLQAHIHPAKATVVAGLAFHPGQPVPGGREDNDGCPLCQAFAVAGAFVAPGAGLLQAPFLHVLTRRIPLESRIGGRKAQFHWQSRAPPAR